MTTFRLNLVFDGVDFDDDDVFEALAAHPHIHWRAQGKLARATAVVGAASALKAADLVTRQVSDAVPSARPLAADEDLVSIPDVADRVGVTREAVRNWANGRRHAGFPLPRGTVGDGIRIWAWADVNSWLQQNLGLGNGEQMPTQQDIGLINAFFRREQLVGSVSEVAYTWSVVANRVSAATETTVAHAVTTGRWIQSGTSRTHLTLIAGELSVAA